ncbi:MAG TPA: DUF4153 domain-containing protein [Oscillospiraceae bacterium]|nr:DUF4153 domain-containing protein [Oscillospiraceae bacterium]HPF55591.1 DUF4153 domain-containing protein [Clostridiales bacterium]HPK35826.1 DUF4153 domain-containing protein [Oscillospiraceae bacterium]HPR76344.1 DUF4153 domain-containing protein [Oscillospiraceae bacterium]
MNKVFRSVIQIFAGALKAFKRYPVSIGCAVAFSIVMMIRIQLDWQQQEPYNFLFNCLNWSFALGAVVSLAATVLAVSRFSDKKAFKLANFFGVLVTAVTFLLLYFFSKINTSNSYVVISNIAQIRIAVLIFIGLILFILFAGFREDRTAFDVSLFMAEKAFFISLIYGLVIFAGASGIAAAFEYLIYSDMSEKVYMYIATLSGLIGYTLFVGYFPDFTKGVADPKRDGAQRQPRFIEVLFSYIMIPIVLALTLVLLIWTGRTVLTGMQVEFVQLYSIAAAYTVGGLWLHAMTIRSESNLAKVYRIVYPIASFIILVFEAWAVIKQLISTGLKTTEYIFILLWVLAFIGSFLILTKKERAHAFVALTACALAIFSILPAVGYQDLPVTVQINRLEKLLVSQNMLTENTLTPAETEPEESVKIDVTDAVYYLIYQDEANLPSWLDTVAINERSFKEVFGFEQAWEETQDSETPGIPVQGIYLSLSSSAMPIHDYDWVVRFQKYGTESIQFTGNNGNYKVDWVMTSESKVPSISISLNNQVLVEQSLDDYFNGLIDQYGLNAKNAVDGTLDNMSIAFETDSFNALLVLNSAEYSLNRSTNEVYYWVEPGALYLSEK